MLVSARPYLLLIVCLIQFQSSNQYWKRPRNFTRKKAYILTTCDTEEKVRKILPPKCTVDFKLPFGISIHSKCPSYRLSCAYYLSRTIKNKLSNSKNSQLIRDVIANDIQIKKIRVGFEREFMLRSGKRMRSLYKSLNKSSDYSFRSQWNLLSVGLVANTKVGYDNNFAPLLVSKATGKGVNIVIVDDGLQTDHPDIYRNVNSSLIMNIFKDDKLLSGEHGTSCASLIVSPVENYKCIVGAAPGATIGVVRALNGKSASYSQLARAVSAFPDATDIYSNSYGATDTGMATHAPHKIFKSAIVHMIKNGRNGLGSIYVWGSGNGGQKDSCGADGFVNNIHIIAVNAVREDGEPAYYAETCSAIMLSAYVGYSKSTAANIGGCRNTFRGTSAAAPMISSCAAVMLQINPRLTWRDVMAILIYSSSLPHGKSVYWQINGAGLPRSETVGFGMLDCTRAARFAKTWKNVGALCYARSSKGKYDKNYKGGHQKGFKLKDYSAFKQQASSKEKYSVSSIKYGRVTEIKFKFDQLNKGANKALYVKQQGSLQPERSSCQLNRVEKVVVNLQMNHICRGSLKIRVESPSGTNSTLLARRENDYFSGEFSLNLVSQTFFGEKIDGVWKLLLIDYGDCKGNKYVKSAYEESYYDLVTGYVDYVTMQIFGTSEADSAYEKNKVLIDPITLSVGATARKSNKATYLAKYPLTKAQQESKWSRLTETAPNP